MEADIDYLFTKRCNESTRRETERYENPKRGRKPTINMEIGRMEKEKTLMQRRFMGTDTFIYFEVRYDGMGLAER